MRAGDDRGRRDATVTGHGKGTFDVNRHFEPRPILKVMCDHPVLFADLPPIPAAAAIAPGFVFTP